MNLTRVDILGCSNERHPCADCNNVFGTYFAVSGGICVDPLCFACIMKYLDEIDAVIA